MTTPLPPRSARPAANHTPTKSTAQVGPAAGTQAAAPTETAAPIESAATTNAAGDWLAQRFLASLAPDFRGPNDLLHDLVAEIAQKASGNFDVFAAGASTAPRPRQTFNLHGLAAGATGHLALADRVAPAGPDHIATLGELHNSDTSARFVAPVVVDRATGKPRAPGGAPLSQRPDWLSPGGNGVGSDGIDICFVGSNGEAISRPMGLNGQVLQTVMLADDLALVRNRSGLHLVQKDTDGKLSVRQHIPVPANTKALETWTSLEDVGGVPMPVEHTTVLHPPLIRTSDNGFLWAGKFLTMQGSELEEAAGIPANFLVQHATVRNGNAYCVGKWASGDQVPLLARFSEEAGSGRLQRALDVRLPGGVQHLSVLPNGTAATANGNKLTVTAERGPYSQNSQLYEVDRPIVGMCAGGADLLVISLGGDKPELVWLRPDAEGGLSQVARQPIEQPMSLVSDGTGVLIVPAGNGLPQRLNMSGEAGDPVFSSRGSL